MGHQICNVKIYELETLYTNAVKLETAGMTNSESEAAIKKIGYRFKLMTG